MQIPEKRPVKIIYESLKDKLNIAKITFTGGVNAASCEFETKNDIARCPLCGIASTIKAYARNADIKSNKKHPIKAPSLQKNALPTRRAF